METSTHTPEQTSNGHAKAALNSLAVTLSYDQLRQLFGYNGDYEDFPAAVIDQLANEIEACGHALTNDEGSDAHMATWRIAERARVAAEVISDYNAQQRKHLASASLKTMLAGVEPDANLEDPKGLISALIHLLYATDKESRAAKFLRATWIELLSNKSMDEWEALAKMPYVGEAREHVEQGWAEERAAVAAEDASDDTDDHPGVMVECNWVDCCTAYNTLRELLSPLVLGAEKHTAFTTALEQAMTFLDGVRVDRGPDRGGVQAHDGMQNEQPEGLHNA